MFDAVNKSGKQRLLEAAEAGGEMPLDFLLRLMRDPRVPIVRRLEAAKASAPFLHPKLSAIDAKLSSVSGNPSPETDTIRIEFVLPSESHTRDGQE
jgi:hypothetical protein